MEQLDTRIRAMLFSLQSNELVQVKTDVTSMHNYMKKRLQNVEQETLDIQDHISDAMRENNRMGRTLDALLCD